LVSHVDRGAQSEGSRELGVEEDIWA